MHLAEQKRSSLNGSCPLAAYVLYISTSWMCTIFSKDLTPDTNSRLDAKNHSDIQFVYFMWKKLLTYTVSSLAWVSHRQHDLHYESLPCLLMAASLFRVLTWLQFPCREREHRRETSYFQRKQGAGGRRNGKKMCSRTCCDMSGTFF